MLAPAAIAAPAVLLALLFAFVQAGSMALFAHAAEPYALPAHLPLQTGEQIYRLIVRAAPAPYALDTLARARFDDGDLHEAFAVAARLPEGSLREEWNARLAAAHGDRARSLRFYVRAGDAMNAQALIDGVAQRDPRAAVAAELDLIAKLERMGDHPDALAEAVWNLGLLHERLGEHADALAQYRRAAVLSPIAAKYLLAAGFQEERMHNTAGAQADFARAIAVDPSSGDAYAGAGLTALDRGDRAQALSYARRAQAAGAGNGALATLLARLR